MFLRSIYKFEVSETGAHALHVRNPFTVSCVTIPYGMCITGDAEAECMRNATTTRGVIGIVSSKIQVRTQDLD